MNRKVTDAKQWSKIVSLKLYSAFTKFEDLVKSADVDLEGLEWA